MTTIITINHDAHRFIELCVKAVHMNTDHKYQHIVVDNGSRPPTIQMLEEFASKGWIKLIRRNIPKGAGGHANSLNIILSSEPSPTICLLDSDAYPINKSWLRFLHETKGAAAAAGFPHFRDETLLHPSCMLFDYNAFSTAGKPSFGIFRDSAGKLWDTGMIVCDRIRSCGFKLVPIPKEKMSEYILHRWCGTRIENERRDALDGVVPKIKFNQETEEWFKQPSAIQVLQ